MIYEWKKKTGHTVDAQVVGEEIEKIADETGGICSPHEYVRRAKRRTSPLHPTLLWDDAEAADLYRVAKARQIISHLTVQVDGESDGGSAFVHVAVMREDGPLVGYMALVDVVQDDELHQQVIADALRQLNGWRKRFAHIKELARVVDAIERLDVEMSAAG